MLSFANEIIVLGDGKIVDRGSYQAILSRKPEIATTSLTALEDDITSSADEFDILRQGSVKSKISDGNVADEVVSNDIDNLRRDGTWSVYVYYFRSAGYMSIMLFALFAGVEAFGTNFPGKL